MLESTGIRLLWPATAERRWPHFKKDVFGLVLMDIQMPEMDGFEATAAIRESECGTGKRQAIIAMMAHTMKGDDRRCLHAGMDGYLAKPIRSEKLYALVDGFPQTLVSAKLTEAADEYGLPVGVEPAS